MVEEHVLAPTFFYVTLLAALSLATIVRIIGTMAAKAIGGGLILV